MENLLKVNVVKFLFSGKIKGLSEESKKLRGRARSKRIKISYYIMANDIIAKNTRHYLLAYGYLKGKKYSDIERIYAKGNAPNANKIFDIIKENVFWYNSYVTIEKIESWINGVAK